MPKFRPWYLLLPAMGLLAFMDLVPFFYGLYLSFNRWIFTTPKPPVFNGFDNYKFLVNDPEFLGSLVRGTSFTLIAVLVQLLLGLATAFLMYRQFRGASIFKIILTLPLAIAPIAVGATWRLMIYPGIGPIPYYLQQVFGVDWNIASNSSMAFVTTIAMDTWHWLPLAALILLAGIGKVPRDILESAQVDGVTNWQRLHYIFLPMIKYEIALVALLRGMDALRIFDEVWMLTGGGPGSATRYLSISLYTLILKGWDIGYGGAISMVFLYIIIVGSWILYQVISRVSD